MQRRIRHSLLLLVLSTLFISVQLRAQSYSIAELRDENTTAKWPFLLYRAAPSYSGLRMFLMTYNLAAVSSLLDAGSLVGQLSDLNTRTETIVPLSLGKAVTCTVYSMPMYFPYKYPYPVCGGKPPFWVEFFIEAPVTLGPWRDLAIGQDPDFLWLVEETENVEE
jgi:hypothetical protein